MHPFAGYIRILGRGKKGSRNLTREEAHHAMGMLLRGETDPLQVGAFLMLLRVKEEHPDEVAGFVEAVRAHCTRPALPVTVDIDWPSYAGKRKQHAWFLLAAIALSQAGYRIFMHGTQGHTPDRLYAVDALRAMGITPCRDWDDVTTALEARQLAYLPLQAFCPALESLIHLKPVLGLRSVANSLVRLINPLDARLLASSIFHPAYGPLHQQALLQLGTQRAVTFKGDGGEIEIRPDASTRLYLIQDRLAHEGEWPRAQEDRQDDEPALSVQALLDLWHGGHHGYGHAAVLQTMAALLFSLGETTTPQEAVSLATTLWDKRQRDALPQQSLDA